MEKLVHLLWRDAAESAEAFAERVVASAGPALVGLGARGVALHAADGQADLGRTVPVRADRRLPRHRVGAARLRPARLARRAALPGDW